MGTWGLPCRGPWCPPAFWAVGAVRYRWQCFVLFCFSGGGADTQRQPASGDPQTGDTEGRLTRSGDRSDEFLFEGVVIDRRKLCAAAPKQSQTKAKKNNRMAWCGPLQSVPERTVAASTPLHAVAAGSGLHGALRANNIFARKHTHTKKKRGENSPEDQIRVSPLPLFWGLDPT